MQLHHFNVDDAIIYGVDKAVILSNLRFWLDKNKEKGSKKHLHENRYWTFNTIKTFSELFPYFTQSKIQRLLKQLEECGAIIVGNFNKIKYDRTRWFTMPEYSIIDNNTFKYVGMNNGLLWNGLTIPYLNTYPNTDKNTDTHDTVNLVVDNSEELDTKENLNIPFDTFWTAYDYKRGKRSDAEAKWLTLSDEERQLTIDSLDAYKASTPDKTYRKYPMSYLNTEAWNDEVVVPEGKPSDNPSNNYSNTSTASHSASFKPFDTVTSDTDTSPQADKPHWWDMKKEGMLKSKSNPTAIKSDTTASKSVDDFLAKFGSKTKDSNSNITSNKRMVA